MSVYISAKLRQQIKTHFKACCAYCQSAESLTVAIFECEHIVPHTAGGETVFENLCRACPTCNRYKTTRQEIINTQTGEPTLLFHPQQQRWQDHFSWNEDSTEIIPLTPEGKVTIEALRMNRPQLIRVRRMWTALGEHPPK